MAAATTIAAVAAVASAGVGAVGAYQQSPAAKSQANYQAQVANKHRRRALPEHVSPPTAYWSTIRLMRRAPCCRRTLLLKGSTTS